MLLNQNPHLTSVSKPYRPPALSFPLANIRLRHVEKVRCVKDPLLSDNYMALNQHAFWMRVEGTGSFFAAGGREVEVAAEPGAAKAELSLYLEGSVLGAILHQRKLLSFHGSCFEFEGRGIMLCGDSGVGKSSLTAAFCQKGGKFLNDDVAPVSMSDGIPQIVSCSDRIKLWEDSLHQLGYNTDFLVPVSPAANKYYYPVQTPERKLTPLHQVFIMERKDQGPVNFIKLRGIQAFVALRNEIYRKEFLPAMPLSEAGYLQQLIDISCRTDVTRIIRPEHIPVKEMIRYIEEYLSPVAKEQSTPILCDDILPH